jgi:hypothetical protein
MENFIILILFWIGWITFCRGGIYVCDKICYYILDKSIDKANTEEDQRKILQLLGV